MDAQNGTLDIMQLLELLGGNDESEQPRTPEPEPRPKVGPIATFLGMKDLQSMVDRQLGGFSEPVRQAFGVILEKTQELVDNTIKTNPETVNSENLNAQIQLMLNNLGVTEPSQETKSASDYLLRTFVSPKSQEKVSEPARQPAFILRSNHTDRPNARRLKQIAEEARYSNRYHEEMEKNRAAIWQLLLSKAALGNLDTAYDVPKTLPDGLHHKLMTELAREFREQEYVVDIGGNTLIFSWDFSDN